MFTRSKPAFLKPHLTFVVIALALIASALIPRGYMVAPSQAHGFQITACPETNPLAQIAAHRHATKQRQLHAAMGHDMDPAEGPASSTSQSGGDCAFAGLGAQGIAPAVYAWDGPAGALEAPLVAAYQTRAAKRLSRLRPPLRGPPIRV